jgi:hypothetical protein
LRALCSRVRTKQPPIAISRMYHRPAGRGSAQQAGSRAQQGVRKDVWLKICVQQGEDEAAANGD